MKYEEIVMACPLERTPWARYMAVDTLTAEDIYKLLREGIQKYENECGGSPRKIVIDSRAFHIIEVDMGKVIRDKPSLTFWGVACEVRSLPDGQVAMIFK